MILAITHYQCRCIGKKTGCLSLLRSIFEKNTIFNSYFSAVPRKILLYINIIVKTKHIINL